MPRGQYNLFDKKAVYLERIKEYQQLIAKETRREKAFDDLKKWLASRKLDHKDLWWMLRKLTPKRTAAAVKSKKPLQPPGPRDLMIKGKKLIQRRGDAEFRRAIYEARMEQKISPTQLAVKLGVSGASVANWEQGRYVPKEEARVKILKVLGLPAHLGAEATKQMEQKLGLKTNGRAAT